MTLDLDRLRLRSGDGRRLDVDVRVDGFSFAGQPWTVDPNPLAATLDVSRTTHNGYALRLRFSAQLHGPCMRCLEPAQPSFSVDAREVDQPGGGDELSSPYVTDGELDLEAWSRDALALSVPDQVICRPGCAGLCPVCGENLNEAGPDHVHEREPDPRWAKLRELKLD